MNIFVSGATGFIGKNLIERISQHNTVYAFIRKQSKPEDIAFLRKNGITLTTTLDDIALCSVVYHLAGQLQKFDLSEKVYRKSNVELTKQIIKRCTKNQKLIFLSTTGVHGPGFDLNEESPYNPNNMYEQTKLESEKLVQSYSRHVIFRPGLVYGKYNQNLQGLYTSIQKGYFFIVGNGENEIQPVDVSLLCDVLVEAIHPSIVNEIFIIAGNKISFNNYYKKLAYELNSTVHNLKIPLFFMKTIVYCYQIICKISKKRPSVTLDGVDLLTQTRTYDIKKSRRSFKAIQKLNKDKVQYIIK